MRMAMLCRHSDVALVAWVLGFVTGSSLHTFPLYA